MYIPDQYKNENHAEIKAFLEQNSFGILVNQNGGNLWATHIPMLLDINENGKEILHGHISKDNQQWKNFTSDQNILAIFSGPHCYVSSSWYVLEEVPTWNYSAVHVYGTIKIIEGLAVMKSLKKLVDKYEAASKNPIRIESLSQKTMRQANGIVTFEIEINEIQAVKKMSQGRDEKDYNTIIDELEKSENPDAAAVAKIMKCPR